MPVAIAIFVKTPGLSPVKTRLANAIGPAATECFYFLACSAVEAVVREVNRINPGLLIPYWAVAEWDGASSPHWKSFPQVYQGEGDLAARMESVYSELVQRHGAVLLMGADSPQIKPRILKEAVQWMEETREFVIGPASDGGFYLWGGSQPIPAMIWGQVPYSHPQTADMLCGKIARLGKVQKLPELFDVDTIQELILLQRELENDSEILPAQHRLLNWLNEFIAAQKEFNGEGVVKG